MKKRKRKKRTHKLNSTPDQLESLRACKRNRKILYCLETGNTDIEVRKIPIL